MYTEAVNSLSQDYTNQDDLHSPTRTDTLKFKPIQLIDHNVRTKDFKPETLKLILNFYC